MRNEEFETSILDGGLEKSLSRGNHIQFLAFKKSQTDFSSLLNLCHKINFHSFKIWISLLGSEIPVVLSI